LEGLFLHFFDTHFSDDFLRSHDEATIEEEADLALRLALLSSHTVYVPAASYFESKLCRKVVSRYQAIFPDGAICLVGRAPNLASFTEGKLKSYDADGRQFLLYSAAAGRAAVQPPFVPRTESATGHLITAWNVLGASEDLESRILGQSAVQLPLGFDKSFLLVPDHLEGRAFTPEYVVPLVEDASSIPLITEGIEKFINEEYFESFTQELEVGTITDMVYFPGYAQDPPLHPCLSYKRTRSELRSRAILHEIAQADPATLLEYRDHPKVVDAFRNVLQETPTLEGAVQLRLRSVDRDQLREHLASLKLIAPGKKGATLYHRAASALLTEIFADSFDSAVQEQEINEGRKRIDIVWPNIANDGFFHWARQIDKAAFVFAECKNYRDDVGNPEVDQLIGRFAPWSSRVGILALRGSKKKERLLDRCRDAYRAGQGLVLPLDDEDLEELVEKAGDGSGTAPWMYARARRIML
jgi:hypothetical protein